MADTTVTVASTGGDYSSIQAALDAADITSGRWIVEVDETAVFDEALTTGSITGTPTSSNHVVLRANADHRHNGTAGTGARISVDGAIGNGIYVTSNYMVIEGLEIELVSPSTSDECIRIQASNVLLSGLILHTASATADTSAAYVGNWDASFSIDDSIIYGFTRGGIHLQQFGSSTARTITANVDHCTIYDCGASGENESGAINVRSDNASDVITVNVYNTVGVNTPETEDFVDGAAGGSGTPSGTVVWNGSHNVREGSLIDLDGTDNITDWQVASSGTSDTTQSSGSYVVFEDLTLGSESFLLLDEAAGNLAANNGTNRQGSEPDARQDFSIDIQGYSRATTGVDIGAHSYGAVAPNPAIAMPLLDATPTFFGPDVINDALVVLPLLDASPTFFDSTVILGVVGPITPILLDASATFLGMVVEPAPYPVVLPITSFSPTFYPARVTGGVVPVQSPRSVGLIPHI